MSSARHNTSAPGSQAHAQPHDTRPAVPPAPVPPRGRQDTADADHAAAAAACPLTAAMHEAHQALWRLFYAHQHAVLRGDPNAARTHLDAYQAAHVDHAAFEDNVLLPIYSRGAPAFGAQPTYFTGEHDKLNAFLSAVHTRLDTWHTALERTPRDAFWAHIALLDKETRLKSLMEHHFSREENRLFHLVFARATSDERPALLEQARALVTRASTALGAAARELETF